MRRRLVLLRHGESGWEGAATDHERLLTPAGEQEAARIGAKLTGAGWGADCVVCSTAERARQTASLAAPNAPCSHHENLYVGGLQSLALVVGALDARMACVWAVGHNPALSNAASALCGESLRLDTANAACLEVEADSWEVAMALTGSFHLHTLLTPH